MQEIKKIAKKINENGGRIFLVGGAIRDEILGIENYDEDYCVTGISFDEFKNLFPEAKIRGKAFPVFDIDNKEFAIARKERKIGLGHKNFDIETDKSITIEEDLARRDITINAIAKDMITKEIIDPYSGIEDLKNRKIRAVTEHFKEDPLRVYRVARFAAKLGFTVDEETIKMMCDLKSELNTISSERVYAEFSKALLTDKPSIFFNVLKRSSVLDVHFREIYNLIGAEQPVKYHPEGDAYNHTMIVLDKSAELTKDHPNDRKLEIRFAALVHDLGKGETPKEEYPHHFLHEQRGVEVVKRFGKNLKIPNRLIKCGKVSCKEHMRGGIFFNMTPKKRVQFIERVDKSILGLDGLQIVVKCDSPDSKEFEQLGKKLLNEVSGEYIKEKYNLKEGIEFGQRLHQERVWWMKNMVKFEK